ncbi:MAG: hypothetical protein KC620_10710 [Myxococcales bacterium]|nr:hypothetical protein [Myxococcales bacterium]
MNDAIDPRLGEGPSELVIDAYVTGEATPDEIAAVETWMAADAENRGVIEARRQGFAAFAEARPQVMLARIRQGLAAAEAEEAAAARPTRPAARKRGRSNWLLALMGALAAAAAAAWFFVLRPPEAPQDTVLAKGTVALRVFRARGDEVVEVNSGEQVRSGDRLRFRPEGLPDGPGYLLVVGVEGTGELFAYAPADGQAVATSGALTDDGALPGSAVLDGSTGRERAVLVWCPTPFALANLAGGAHSLQTPAGCRQAGVALEKR